MGGKSCLLLSILLGILSFFSRLFFSCQHYILNEQKLGTKSLGHFTCTTHRCCGRASYAERCLPRALWHCHTRPVLGPPARTRKVVLSREGRAEQVSRRSRHEQVHTLTTWELIQTTFATIIMSWYEQFGAEGGYFQNKMANFAKNQAPLFFWKIYPIFWV